MTTQVNLKIDKKLKKEAEQLAKKIGLNLSTVLRLLLANFVNTKKINIALGNYDSELDTDPQLTGQLMELILVKEGKSSAYAKAVGESYQALLDAEKGEALVNWQDV